MSELIFERAEGRIVWGAKRYRAVSGPWGRGVLPAGKYRVEVRDVVVGSGLSAGYRDKKTGHAWFIPIKPRFKTSRDGLGIHPDGGVPGTLGCIGLVGTDCELFWERWIDTQMLARPETLLVQ